MVPVVSSPRDAVEKVEFSEIVKENVSWNDMHPPPRIWHLEMSSRDPSPWKLEKDEASDPKRIM